MSDAVNVLVVDDFPKNLLAMQALLERPGLNVLSAASGVEALELLLVHEVALALIDLNMPEMNGFELAELVRGNPRTRAIPLIFITAGMQQASLTFEGYRAGAVDFLNKPFNPEILRSKVEVFVELYSQRKQLAARLAELQKALQVQREAEEKLLEADRRKDEFMAVLAHELRNPLAPIRSALDIFELLAPKNEVLTNARLAATRQVDHMTNLVNDLLDTARISRGKVSLHRELCDLSQLARDTAEDYRGSFEAKGTALLVDVPEAPLPVTGDPTRIAQCIGNLLHNAAKFSPPGTTVTVRAFDRPSAQGERLACIDVQDQGCGMDEAMLAQIFTPFTQGSQEASRGKGGLGLGLALVKGLVELHGGTVSAASGGAGRGSCLSIALPLSAVQAGPQQPGHAPGEDSSDTGSLKVLVIDDNRDYLATMQAALLARGHQVAVAEEGEDALEKARQMRPDVVLCDLGLPGALDGFAIARRLRQDPDMQRASLIAISGYGSEADKEKAQQAGFDRHFSKPVSLAQLPLAPRTVPGTR